MMRSAGSSASVVGILVACGLYFFALSNQSMPPAERRALVRLAMWGAIVAFVGSLIELGGIAGDLGVGWDAAATSRFGRAASLRALAAAILALSWFETERAARERLASDHPLTVDPRGPLDYLLFPAALLGLFSFSLDGHTASVGPRAVHGVLNAVHATAASVWLGGVVALAVIAATRRGGVRAELKAFTPVATAAVIALTVAGVVMAFFVLDSPSQLTSSPWGRRLLVKVVAVAIALGLGWHHRSGIERGQPLRRTLTIEAGALLVAGIVTGLMINSSPV